MGQVGRVCGGGVCVCVGCVGQGGVEAAHLLPAPPPSTLTA